MEPAPRGGFLFKQIPALFAGQRTEVYDSILVKVNPGSFIAILVILICHSLARPTPVVPSVKLMGITACTMPGLLWRDDGGLLCCRSNLVHK